MLNNFFTSYKRVAGVLFLAALALSIPLTLSILSTQKDIRQRADTPAQIADGENYSISGPSAGGGNSMGVFNPGLYNQTGSDTTNSTQQPPSSSYQYDPSNGGQWVDGNGNIVPVGGTEQNQIQIPAGYRNCGSGGIVPAGSACPSGSSNSCPAGYSGPPSSCPVVDAGPTVAAQSQASNQTSNQAASASQGSASCPALHPGIDTGENQIIGMMNDYRAQHGAPPFALSGDLNVMAANLAEDEAAHAVQSHVDSLGRDFSPRLVACNIDVNTIAPAGENVGSSATVQGIYNAWLASPEHNDNILNPSFLFTGIARMYNPQTHFYYWDQVFAAHNPGGSVASDTSTDTTPTVAQTNPTATPIVVATFAVSPTTAPTAVLSGTIIASKITLPGIGANVSLGENTTPVTQSKTGQIQLTSSTNQIISNNVTFTFDGGNFTFSGGVGNLTAGTYDVKVRTDNSLWHSLGSMQLTANQTTTAPTTALVTRDLNADNVLNLADYNIFLSCYGTKACANKQVSDLNLDGKVDEKDLNIFYSGLAKRTGD